MFPRMATSRHTRYDRILRRGQHSSHGSRHILYGKVPELNPPAKPIVLTDGNLVVIHRRRSGAVRDAPSSFQPHLLPPNALGVQEFIKRLPKTDHPAAFGQHVNADITSLIDDTNALLGTMVSLSGYTLHPETENPEIVYNEHPDDMIAYLIKKNMG